MPSPFPGMNPYFEQKDHWLDFHTEFLSALRRLLAPRIGPKYIVQLEEHIYIHDLPPGPRQRLGTAGPVAGPDSESANGLRPRSGCWRPRRRSGCRSRTSRKCRSWKSGTARAASW